MGCGVSASREKALMEAAERGNTNKVSSLLKAGTNVNCRDWLSGRTPLIQAAFGSQRHGSQGHSAQAAFRDTVQLLLEYKADIEATDRLKDRTALERASGATREVLEAAAAAKKEVTCMCVSVCLCVSVCPCA
jgi:ankyrin repeat protein